MEENIFHIHTFRCKHASDENDEEYVKAALALGAGRITFTDHTPFPGNPFKNRMDMEQLPEYIKSMRNLQEKYRNHIAIDIGLEVEFLPSMRDFYEDLSDMGLNPLIIGQHFYQHDDGRFSFNDDKDFNKANEFIGCGNAMIEAMKTGIFSIAAHPDRIFRRCKKWFPDMEDISKKIIAAAVQNDVVLEKNLSSYEKHLTKSSFIHWRKEFWDLIENYNSDTLHPVRTIIGFDAHSVEDMKRRYEYKIIAEAR